MLTAWLPIFMSVSHIKPKEERGERVSCVQRSMKNCEAVEEL